MDKSQENPDLEAVLAQLNCLDGLTATAEHGAAGAVVRLRYGPVQTDLQVVDEPRPDEPFGRLLVRREIGTKEAELFKNQNVNFVDTLGNAYLRGPNFLLWITGRAPEGERPVGNLQGDQRVTTDTPIGPQNRAFEPKGLQVVFVVLCEPDGIALPYRELAELADVAHGTVGHVVNDLEDLGYVARGPAPKGRKRGPRKLVNRAGLLDEWARLFAKTARHRHMIGRYRGLPLDEIGTRPWNEYGAELGGEFAADAVTRYLQPATLTLYLRGDRPEAPLLRDLRLQPDPEGRIELLRKFWQFETPETDYPDVVPLPLVYADLIAIGEPRCLETADQIRERILQTEPHG